MKVKDFNDISMNGRMAYSILCIEEYLTKMYPNEDWAILSKYMWSVTSSYWDEWDDKFVEIIPEYLFEFDSYEESDFEELSNEDYDSFSSLFKGKEKTINQLLMSLHRLEGIYSYSSIPNFGEEASQIVLDICKILDENNISLPPIETVSFSKFNEKNGWGENFDGSKLSIILK